MPDALRQAERRLADALVESRPGEAATALEEIDPVDGAAILSDADLDAAARVLARMLAPEGSAVLDRLPEESARGVLARLSPRVIAALLRRLPEPARQRLLELLGEDERPAVARVLEAADGTAAALMDPRVLALPADLEVRAARARVLEHPDEAHYNLYVVDRDGRLVGVLNLRELLTLPESELLSAVMNPPTWSIPAHAERLDVIAHPGWRHVHSLPVVDEGGRFLGAIRYRTLRVLEEQAFREVDTRAASTSQALGDLYWTGVSGVVSALMSALEPETRRDDAAEGTDGDR
jgi:magnesium transporter